MDDNVLAAMARWPNVPDVFGWLSLSANGEWRLHPEADAWTPGEPCPTPPPAGESIESRQIVDFINKNYAYDDFGQWYFQNGPQRVYVRLDVAPFVLFIDDAAMGLRTHTHLPVQHIHNWWLDETGHLYAVTEHGPGIIAGRETSSVFQMLYTADGLPLLDALENLRWDGTPNETPSDRASSNQSQSAAFDSIQVRFGNHSTDGPSKNVPRTDTHTLGTLSACRAKDLESILKYVPCPRPRS